LIIQFIYHFLVAIFTRRGILDFVRGKEGSNSAWESSQIPTSGKGNKALWNNKRYLFRVKIFRGASQSQ
jgi:hypothetical protein